VAIEHYTVTLNGSPQDLVTALALIFPRDDFGFATMIFQAGVNNVGDVLIGGTGGANYVPLVTATSYGMNLSAADPYRRPVVIPAAGGSAIRLSDWSVLGTAGDKLFITGVGR
jgi:hypothetical protein